MGHIILHTDLISISTKEFCKINRDKEFLSIHKEYSLSIPKEYSLSIPKELLRVPHGDSIMEIVI